MSMPAFCKPFTTAQVRYFTPDKFDEARMGVKCDSGIEHHET
jgi:hypothetical protein